MRAEQPRRADAFALLAAAVYVAAWWLAGAAFTATEAEWWNSLWAVAVPFGLAAVLAGLGQSERLTAFVLLLVTWATFVGLIALRLFH